MQEALKQPSAGQWSSLRLYAPVPLHEYIESSSWLEDTILIFPSDLELDREGRYVLYIDGKYASIHLSFDQNGQQ